MLGWSTRSTWKLVVHRVACMGTSRLTRRKWAISCCGLLRLAALLEFFEFDALLVSLPSMQTAIRWGDEHLNMARNAYRAGPSEADLVALARQMLRWFRDEYAALGPIGHGHITSRCPGVFRGKASLIEQTLDYLLVNGFVMQVPSIRGKRFAPTTRPGLDA